MFYNTFHVFKQNLGFNPLVQNGDNIRLLWKNVFLYFFNYWMATEFSDQDFGSCVTAIETGLASVILGLRINHGNRARLVRSSF